jgi:glycine oxidase
MPAQGGGFVSSSEGGRYDAVVVGGGIVGLAVAWRAAQRGLATCVLERGEPGREASRVAAGMLAPVNEADFGEERLLELSLAAARGYPEVVAELEDASGLDVGFRRSGALHVAFDRDEAEHLRRLEQLHHSLGLESEWLGGEACRELEPGLSPACRGGLHAPAESHVDPRALTRALGEAAEQAGARVLAGAEAAEATLDGDRLRGVRTTDGRAFEGDSVVLAAGAWSGEATWLPADARPPVRPVKGQLLNLRGPAGAPLVERVVRTPWVYVVPRPDGRVVVGATSEERGFDTTITAGATLELLRESYRALPEIAELELVECSAGLRPGTPDNLPLVGPGLLDGLVLATGHYRNGILLAPLTGAAVAALLAGEELEPPLTACAPDRFEAVAR